MTDEQFEKKYGFNRNYDFDLTVYYAGTDFMGDKHVYKDELNIRCSLRRQLRKKFKEIDPNNIDDELSKDWDKI